MITQLELRFDGDTIVPERDNERLGRQSRDVFDLMKDGRWRTLDSIAAQTDHPPASISARLRDFRKPRFGGYTVERRHVSNGLFEYRIII